MRAEGTSKILICALAIASMLAVVGPSSQASAYAYLYCPTSAVKYATTPVAFQVDSANMSAGQHTDVDYALTEWNDVVGMTNVFGSHTHAPGGQAIPPIPNGSFNLWSSSGSDFEGAGGAAWNVWDGPTCDPTVTIVESDVWFAEDIGLITGSPPCEQSGQTLRAVLLHELGHSLGLEHWDTSMGVMMTNDGFFRYCGNTTERIWLGPDDVLGGTFLYPTSGTTRDLAASTREYNSANNTTFVDWESGQGACPGQPFTIEWSRANLGNLSVASYNVRFYLSADKTITTSDTLLATNIGESIPAMTWSTSDKNLTVPVSVGNGTKWYVGWILDYGGAIVERNESNNWAFVPEQLEVCP